MFNYYGIGSFQPIEGTMHSPQYVEVFRRVVPELEKALQWFQDLSAGSFPLSHIENGEKFYGKEYNHT